MHNQPPNNVLEVFCTEFIPGISDDFESVMSTEEICDIISKQTGTTRPSSDIMSELKAKGFKYKVIDGTMFWLLKESA